VLVYAERFLDDDHGAARAAVRFRFEHVHRTVGR
jgi:hypothetical protein